MLIQFIGWSFILVLALLIMATILTIYVFIWIIHSIKEKQKYKFQVGEPITKEGMDEVIRNYLKPFNYGLHGSTGKRKSKDIKTTKNN